MRNYSEEVRTYLNGPCIPLHLEKGHYEAIDQMIQKKEAVIDNDTLYLYPRVKSFLYGGGIPLSMSVYEWNQIDKLIESGKAIVINDVLHPAD